MGNLAMNVLEWTYSLSSWTAVKGQRNSCMGGGGWKIRSTWKRFISTFQWREMRVCLPSPMLFAALQLILHSALSVYQQHATLHYGKYWSIIMNTVINLHYVSRLMALISDRIHGATFIVHAIPYAVFACYIFCSIDPWAEPPQTWPLQAASLGPWMLNIIWQYLGSSLSRPDALTP
jgi:hypothetical protein